MKKPDRYTIDIFGLGNHIHTFEFTYDDAFFSDFEESPVDKGKGVCTVDLTKTDTMITLNIHIKGMIVLTCDRSLEAFEHPIDLKQELIYKYGVEKQELSESVFVILKDEQQINIATFMYEFISLEIPMKKLHPKFHEESKEDALVFSSGGGGEEPAAPAWDALKKLK